MNNTDMKENKTPFGTRGWASRNENLIKGCGLDYKGGQYLAFLFYC